MRDSSFRSCGKKGRMQPAIRIGPPQTGRNLIRTFFSLFVVWFLAGCGSSDLPIGTEVVVQFDRSALGAAADLPVPPTTSGINGAATSVSGKLERVTTEWIRLRTTTGSSEHPYQTTLWIPQDKVLMIMSSTPLTR